MRVQVLQHVPFEGLGSMEGWLAASGAERQWTRFHQAGAKLPQVAEVDAVITLGGPMSVNDEAALPWLADEKRFLREACAAGKPVLGICLGAQLLASAHGGQVRRMPVPEIGWFGVEGVRAQAGSFPFPSQAQVFHWHGEAIDLPIGARQLARNPACQNQAFQWGARAIGLQFHPEATPASVAAMLVHCGDDLVPGPTVQDAATLRAVHAIDYVAANELMDEVLAWLFKDEA